MLLTHTEKFIVRRLSNDTHTEYVVEKYNVHGQLNRQLHAINAWCSVAGIDIHTHQKC